MVTNFMFLYQLHANRHFFVLLDKSIVCIFISMIFTRDLDLQLKAGVSDLCFLVDWF